MVGLGVALTDFVQGITGSPNKRFYNRNFCSQVDYAKSFVRGFVPYKNKIGGGYRVKQIVTEDKWDSMTGGQETKTTYGQVYDYTVAEGKLNISSGVAQYEPIFGGDEISLRSPIPFEIEKSMAPNDHFYQENPLGEMMYPAPLVGYSKVTVTTMPDPGASSPPTNVCKIGKTEYEFYTAKDYPIIAQKTGLRTQLQENDLIEDFIINTSSIKIFYATQGHMLKFNDMHGKLKSINSYGENNLTTPISGVKYTYKSSGAANGSKQLITTVQTIDENNTIAPATMSRDIDISSDTKENMNESVTTGSTFLLEIGLILNFVNIVPPPYMIVIPYPQIPVIDHGVVYGEQKYGSKTATITKIVQQYGILEKVESFTDKAKTTSENLLWDRSTGAVVLTKTTNNLDQPVFNFNYPAYWIYPQLGHEFKRDGIELFCQGVSGSNPTPIWNFASPNLGGFKKVDISNILTPGDEVIIMNASTGAKIGERFWVQIDNTMAPNDLHFLVDQHGAMANASAPYNLSSTTDYVVKIVKPVNENNLYESAGYVTSQFDPAVNANPGISTIINFSATGQQIIDSKALKFCTSPGIFVKSSTTQHYTNLGSDYYSSASYNSFMAGFQKKLQPGTSYVYSTERSYANQPNMKKDGFYSTFTPFWTYIGAWMPGVITQWAEVNNNSVYSPYGYLVESTDAILQPSTQSFCFNHTLPALTASNARFGEAGFESFEEYYNAGSSSIYNSMVSIDVSNVNNNDFLGFYGQITAGTTPPAINTTNSHTGRTSVLFTNGTKVKLTHDLSKLYDIPVTTRKLSTFCAPNFINLCKLNLQQKKYLVSMWVKGAMQSTNYSGQVDFKVQANYSTPVVITPVLMNPGSPVINGWQKLDYQFTIPAGTGSNGVELQIAPISGGSFYMDDFRIQPYNSQMICNVYDPLSLRLWAQMDDQNYATLLEYDNEGMLVRKKKETLKGLYTTQESRRSTVKN